MKDKKVIANDDEETKLIECHVDLIDIMDKYADKLKSFTYEGLDSSDLSWKSKTKLLAKKINNSKII